MLSVIKEKNYLYPFVLWLILLLWYLIFANNFFSAPQRYLDNFISEQAFWFFKNTPEEANEITVIAIDEASRRRLNLKWPWKRSVTAGLIRQIAAHSPKVIGLDIVFAGKSQSEEDLNLVAALKSHAHVILGYVLYKNSPEKPAEDFIDAAHSIGFVNKPLQEGLVTETRLFEVDDADKTEFSLEMEILISYLGLDQSTIKVDQKGVYLKDGRFIPALNGVTSLNYLAHPTNLKIIPAFEVLEGKIDPLDLRNKIVLVGATDPLIHDEYATPLGVLPGVTIVANSLLTILSQRFVFKASVAQNILLSFALGFVILLINRRFNLLFNTLCSLVVMIIIYWCFVFLRARDYQFAYLSIFFSGTTAYFVPTIYKYLNLLYLSNRLKNLSLVDPLTGLNSLRYFLLQLDEIMNTRQEFAFVALSLGNYRRLTQHLNFEQIKLLTCLFAENLHSAVKKHFKNPIFTRISNDTLGIIFQKASKEELNKFLGDFFQTTRELGWKLEQQILNITLQGCLIHRTRSKTGKSDDLMLQMEKLLNHTRADELLVEDFEQVADEGRTAKRVDILDFIAYDWQERNKDLEQAFKEILGVNRRLDQLSRGALTALARTIDAKSKWTAGHSERVTQLALKLGRALGLKEMQLEKLYYGGLLHDIGKIGTPAELLDKKGRLSDHEYRVMREHPSIGKRILEPIDAFADLLPIVKHHHEHFDGTGYPDGLAGDDIDFSARIVAVADVFDALSSERPYRVSMPADKAFHLIKKDSGSHFDPLVVDALAGVLEQDKKLPKSGQNQGALFADPIAEMSGIDPSGKPTPI